MTFRLQFRSAACCAIPLLAAFLGGSTELWSEGIILLLLAALIALHPPRALGFRYFLWAMLFLVILASTAILPAGWFGIPGWRHEMVRYGIPLTGMLSPQPRASAHSMVLLLAGIAWIYWLCSQSWLPEEKRRLIELFVTGAAILATVALVAFYCGKPVPFWHSERGFGPFPNRNQTGDFFAISGILAIACTYENFRGGKMGGIWFPIACALICAALVSSYSRAAVVLFFAGSIIWIVSLGLISRSPKAPAVCASLLVVATAAFLLFGGTTLERLQGAEGVTLGFRRMIYKDAFSLIHASPWTGIGLGNFEGVFALFRKESAMPSRILHPESDWLWLWAEMGWTAIAAVIVASCILLKKVFPLDRGTNRRLRLAAGVAALVFAVHGIVDVPGHRLGSALPGLFMLGMALNNPRVVPENRRVAAGFRVGAVAMAVAGTLWLVTGFTGLEATKKLSHEMIARQSYPLAIEQTTGAIARMPLDWQLYYIRGMAEAYSGNWPRAYDDFRRVNLLESTSHIVTFEEGRIWMSSQPSYAIPAWRETLRRCPSQEAAQYYEYMLGYTGENSVLLGMLRSLAGGRKDLGLVWLSAANGEELKTGIRSILQSDPDLHSLTDGQKTTFFRLWAKSGDPELMQRLSQNTYWQHLAWRQIAADRASRKDLRGACEVAFQSMPQPALPKATVSGDNQELHRRLLRRPDDFLAGYTLYTMLKVQGNFVAAMDVLQGLAKSPDCPRYIYFLEADLAFRMQDFPDAWKALQKYEPGGG